MTSTLFDEWVVRLQELCKPQNLHIVTGEEEETAFFEKQFVASGMGIPLTRERSFLALSDPRDTARIESRTFICSRLEKDAGPTNHWADPQEMRQKLQPLFSECMKGKTLYVIPFCMGPLDSPFSIYGVQFTDSLYVVLNMGKMCRIGKEAHQRILKKAPFIACIHSTGNKGDPLWPCDPEHTYVTHFPEDNEVWSYGSGYGGNALLGKKCVALRIASVKAKKEQWLAEHMLIIGVTDPKGRKVYISAAFPSACGKTNLAMIRSQLPGYSVECIGDDIAWIRPGEDGRLYAVNPETGFFGVAPGTSLETNPNAMKTIEKNTIFTNCALTKEEDVWWEGMTKYPPELKYNWKKEPWREGCGEKAAHPNARFTAPSIQCPSYPKGESHIHGVPLSAIIFGGRRSSTIPLVVEAPTWNRGVLYGAALSSETTAAASDEHRAIRHDPFAMLPFCGYHMAEYFSHWLSFNKARYTLPRIYQVNWFRKEKGEYVWPGFGENMKVIAWIVRRIFNEVNAQQTPLGYIPLQSDFSVPNFNALFYATNNQYCDEIASCREYFHSIGGVPKPLFDELDAVEALL